MLVRQSSSLAVAGSSGISAVIRLYLALIIHAAI